MCAQGQALHFLDGLSVDELRQIEQSNADKRVAKLFGISVAHSVLLRIVNDQQAGAPSCVIRNPEQVLGDQAQAVLAFWRHIDEMTPEAWAKARIAALRAAWAAVRAREAAREAAMEAAGAAAGAAAGSAAEAAAEEVAQAAAWEAAGAAWAAAGASNEIQGAAIMRQKGQPFFFLPLFGFSNPEDVIASP